jgi:hypothetical protein
MAIGKMETGIPARLVRAKAGIATLTQKAGARAADLR